MTILTIFEVSVGVFNKCGFFSFENLEKLFLKLEILRNKNQVIFQINLEIKARDWLGIGLSLSAQQNKFPHKFLACRKIWPQTETI